MTPGESLDSALGALSARIDAQDEVLADLRQRVEAMEQGEPAPEPEPTPDPEPEPEPDPEEPPVEEPPVEEPPVDPPTGSLAQFISYDGSSGPNRTYWNRGVELRWLNQQVGDWTDADGTPQGDKPYATANIAAAGPHEWDVTALVGKQLAGHNRGFFLRASGTAFRFVFAGRRHADASLRPVLRVVTDTGEFACPATANAEWLLNSYASTDTSASFGPQQNQRHAIVQFDYSGITGSVLSATMALHVTGTPRAGSVSVFEADPPAYQTGRSDASVFGISAAFRGDKGLREHPSVLFASDFTDGNGVGTFADWNVRDKDRVPNLLFDPDTGLPFNRRQFKAGDFEPDSGHGSILLARGTSNYGHETTNVVEECYFRYRVRLGEDWRSTVDANKMPGFDLGFGYWRTTNNGYWQQVSGNGGIKGDGRLKPSWHKYPAHHELAGQPIVAHHGHMSRGHGGMYYPGNPYSERFVWLGTYLYHIDQDGFYGDSLRWGEAVLERGRWHDIEHRIKVNSLTGPEDSYGNREAVADGVYETWLDGVPVFRREGVRWRRHPAQGIESVFTGWYHGGKFPTNRAMTVDVGHFVAATEYIGPLVV